MSFTMEAYPLRTVIGYNLIYVCVKQAWLYYVLSVRNLNSCVVIFVNLNFIASVVGDVVKMKISVN